MFIELQFLFVVEKYVSLKKTNIVSEASCFKIKLLKL